MAVRLLAPSDKQAIASHCEKFVTERLKPLVFSTARPDPIQGHLDILGKWRGSRYVFLLRSRSNFPETAGQEFDTPFACLAHRQEIMAEKRFDVQWFRHTGRWWTLHSAVTIDEGLKLIETNPILHPPL